MELTILGTSATLPTKTRNHSGYLLVYKAEGLLFDCGEGMQRQLKTAGISFSKITRIFLTHWHGDHMLGLPGLLQSMAMQEYSRTLQIYGPPGSKEKYQKLLDAFESSYPITAVIHEVKEGAFLETDDFVIEAYPLMHKIKCYGYRFAEKDKRKINMTKLKKLGVPEGPIIGKIQEGKTIVHNGKKITPEEVTTLIKGRIFAYIPDTRPTKNCQKIAQDADVLLCESTYTQEHQAMAEEHHHLTAQEAGQIASSSNAKKLILTHFSARYKNESELAQDARTVFDNTFAAKDFMKIQI